MALAMAVPDTGADFDLVILSGRRVKELVVNLDAEWDSDLLQFSERDVSPFCKSRIPDDSTAEEEVFIVVFRNELVTSADKAAEIVSLILNLDLCDFER